MSATAIPDVSQMLPVEAKVIDGLGVAAGTWAREVLLMAGKSAPIALQQQMMKNVVAAMGEQRPQFRFRRDQAIGAPGAEEDGAYLSECYYDSGDLDLLRDCESRKCVVVGRTGTGKTAILLELQKREEHARSIDPHELSLQYLSNSTILPYLHELGVKLSLFYKLLWKHVFLVELIRGRFKIRSESHKKSILERFRERFQGDKAKEEALEYLEQWGESFWKDTEFRVREVTRTFEEQIETSLGADVKLIKASTGNRRAGSQSERAEVIHKAQKVVDDIRIQQLRRIEEMLAKEYFSHAQPRYYLIVDSLDEDWVDDQFRYDLIRALIDAARDFAKHRSAKVVLALRADLIERVFRSTRGPGFQQEKYDPLLLNMRWEDGQLLGLVDLRVQKLVRHQYTKRAVSWHELMPKKMGGVPIKRYLLERTMYRPRDLIVFFNQCIEQAHERPLITQHMVSVAEGEYSKRRLAALGDEWHADFPELIDLVVALLKKRSRTFKLSALDEADSMQKVCLKVIEQSHDQPGDISKWCNLYLGGELQSHDVILRLSTVLFKVGVLGLKTEPFTRVLWSYKEELQLSPAEVNLDCKASISPIFHRVLGVKSANGRGGG